MAANPNNPITLPDGRTAYEAVCDVCGKLCVQWVPDPLSIPTTEKIYDMVGRTPQLCDEHAPPRTEEPPAAPIPDTITPAQVRIAAMIVLGLPSPEALDQIVEGVINSPEAGLSDFERQAARVKWQHATVIERGHPLIQAVAVYLGVSSEVIDDVFRIGATL